MFNVFLVTSKVFSMLDLHRTDEVVMKNICNIFYFLTDYVWVYKSNSGLHLSTCWFAFEPAHIISYKTTCATTEISDQADSEDWSACADAQADQSSLSASRLDFWLPIQFPAKDFDQTVRMRRLTWVYAGCSCKLVENTVPWLIYHMLLTVQRWGPEVQIHHFTVTRVFYDWQSFNEFVSGQKGLVPKRFRGCKLKDWINSLTLYTGRVDFRYVRLYHIDIPKEKWLNYLQIMETFIGRCDLRPLICVCTVCQLPD